MPPPSRSVKQEIARLIKKFKFEELESAVLPIFPELSWVDIKSTLVKNHDSLTTNHAVTIIEGGITRAHFSKSVLEERIKILDITEVSRHPDKKFWYTYEFKSSNSLNLPTLDEIKDNIKKSYDVYQMRIDVQAIKHNGFIFLSIKECPKKKQPKSIRPTYLSLVLEEKLCFCAKKNVSKELITAVTAALGYRNCKRIKLLGKDIKSLVQLLLARKNAALQGNLIRTAEPLKQTPPVSTMLGLDFTQQKQRQEYAEKYFGVNPPTFELLTVKSFDQTWKQEDVAAKLPNDKIFTEIEFRSRSIPNFFKGLVTQRVLTTPLPYYAANILTLGRNDLTVKESI